jgi:hypothetical protein
MVDAIDEAEVEGHPRDIGALTTCQNSRITLDVYTKAVNSHKRAAQSKVVQMIVLRRGHIEGGRRTGI